MDVLERLAAELKKFSSVRGAMPAGKNESLLLDAHAEIERLRACRPEALIPEGWQLVPIEATTVMCTLLGSAYRQLITDEAPAPDLKTLYARYRAVWETVVKASPSPQRESK